jgi:DNA-binding response OmpR family regulator
MAKILIVEDDEILQRMYKQRLESEGYEVFVARDGREGLLLAQTKGPDLVLLDIMLPGGMNGFDVLEQLKKDEKTKDVLVLVLTNLESEEKTAKEIGAFDYLVKANTKPDQVVAKVKELLSLSKKS